ncbi:MAG: PEGA domain-containing protein [Sandaracinaceae bacterium]|nr:PEGA domain-containing protein [Sandaracinaceae bacterium]
MTRPVRDRRAWAHAGLIALLVALGGAAPARAQDEAPSAEPPPEVVPVTTQAASREAPGYARPRPAAPIMVIVLPEAGIDEAVVGAAREALVAALGPMANGRAVHGLVAPPLLGAFASCRDEGCYGGQLASAGAGAGALLRLARRGRALFGTLELRDPVSGSPRSTAIEASLPATAGEIAAPVAAMAARLTGAMPSGAAPPATLLVTTTVDGATVTVDGEAIGTSPVAPIEIADGEHEVVVRLAGYPDYRTSTRIAPGGRARVDATLRREGARDGASARAGGEADPFAVSGDGGGDVTSEWWFWTIIGAGAAVLIAIAIGVGVAVADGGGGTPGQPRGVPLPPIVGGM